MTAKKMFTEAEESAVDTFQGALGDEALRTGLSLILADAARSHLKAGNLDKATLCLHEAQRCLGVDSSP